MGVTPDICQWFSMAVENGRLSLNQMSETALAQSLPWREKIGKKFMLKPFLASQASAGRHRAERFQ